MFGFILILYQLEGHLGCQVLAGHQPFTLEYELERKLLIFPHTLLGEMGLGEWNIFRVGERKEKGGLGTEIP